MGNTRHRQKKKNEINEPNIHTENPRLIYAGAYTWGRYKSRDLLCKWEGAFVAGGQNGRHFPESIELQIGIESWRGVN